MSVCRKFIFIIVLFLFVPVSQSACLNFCGVSLIELTTSSDVYHNKLVKVRGVLGVTHKNSTFLYLDTEKKDYQLVEYATVIEISDKNRVIAEKLKGQYVSIVGVFDKNYTGNLGISIGGIFDVESIEIVGKALNQN